MRYNLSLHIDRERFKRRCNALFKSGAYVELTDCTKRTTAQNAYLHLIIGYLAIEVGVSLEYAKVNYYKAQANKELFALEVADPLTGEIKTDYRSTTALRKEEMALSIDRFRDWSALVAGIYLPEAGETDFLQEIDREIQNNQKHL